MKAFVHSFADKNNLILIVLFAPFIVELLS